MRFLLIPTSCSTAVSCSSPRWRCIIGCPRSISIAHSRGRRRGCLLSYRAEDVADRRWPLRRLYWPRCLEGPGNLGTCRLYGATKFEFVIDEHAAKLLGITV